MRGVDRNVVRLLRDRTEGNTMEKVWRQVQENHVEEYLHRRDLYTTLLMSIAAPGGIVSEADIPGSHIVLPLNNNNNNSIILNAFQVVKKLFGQGRGSAEWFTSIGNEYSQIVSSVLTCEESAQKLLPMCRGVKDRFRLANQPVPKILYIDRGCCHAKGPTAVETMFQERFDGGMVVRLDIFHWIHRFDAAIRTDAHSKYAVFKSALAGAVLAYNRTDLELLIEAVRAKDQDVGHLAIEELKGPAGQDQSGVTLFKTPAAIDEMWVGQQRRLECIQDPPGMIMYRVARTTTINGVDLPYYKSLRGSNSLEGFHKSLPHMIPGPRCAARPYQVYLISGIARWNCDRSSDAVFGGKGRHHRTYSAPLIHRLNARCQQLFGETVEVDSHELLGLEDLFSQSTGESGPFSLEDIIHDGPGPDEEVVQPGQPTPDPEADEAYQSDGESHCEGDHVLDAILPHITLVTDETSSVNPLLLRMPAVKTLFPATHSWRGSAHCWWTLGSSRTSCPLSPSRGTRSWLPGPKWRTTTNGSSSSTSCTGRIGATPCTAALSATTWLMLLSYSV
ncbi:uncharacterized protein [Pseudochaenichthys georgianus]|uniref:uncharacterized protein n=1 Tax=Pseudochaenichthys georgianus TaxID=52239 RepID=UPI00146BDBB8|nr:uncharacterized protein LOC117453530 isoform X2 [Pseudochaenichthys georgianus]